MRGQVRVYQKKIVAKKRRRALFMSLYSALALSLVFSALSYISHIGAFQIDRVGVVGNSRLSASAVESIVDDRAAGNYMGLFSKRNSFLFPENEIQRAVLALPEVKNAEVSRKGLREVSVRMEERKEVALWCALRDDGCYSLDENGLVFSKSAGTSTPDLIYKGAIEGDPLGKNLLSPKEFRKLRFFMGQLAGLSIEPREVTLENSGYMRIALGDGGKLIVNRDDDLSVVLENIATIISDKSVAPSFSDFLQNLDYIKLDSGSKAVYKMKK